MKINKYVVGLFSAVLSLVPNSAFAAAKGLVYECGDGMGDCNWGDLVAAVQNLVNKLTVFAIAFSVVVIVYAGFTYMTSEGSPAKLNKAHKMFQSVAIGIALMLGAWVIVTMIASALGVTAFKFTP